MRKLDVLFVHEDTECLVFYGARTHAPWENVLRHVTSMPVAPACESSVGPYTCAFLDAELLQVSPTSLLCFVFRA